MGGQVTPPFPCPRHAELEERVEGLERRPNTDLLLPELARLQHLAREGVRLGESHRDAIASLRDAVDALIRVQSEVCSEQARAAAELEGVKTKISDTKEQAITALKAQTDFLVGTIQQERAQAAEVRKADLTEQTDRRRFRHRLVLAVVGGALTILGGATGRATAHAQCSPSAVGR